MKRIILLMLAMMLLIPAVVSCAPKDDTKTSDLGIYRSNLVETDGWVYYNTADGLFKIRSNGEDKTMVLDTPPLMLSVYDDCIYYVPHEEDSRKLIPVDEERLEYISVYSCSTDGSDDRFICETQFNLYEMKKVQMRVVDGWIYVGLLHEERDISYDLYRMRIDGTGMTMISPENEVFFDFSIDDDGWIYYITAGEYDGRKGAQLWRMYHDGTNNHQIMHEVGLTIDYSNNEIYYSDVDNKDIYAISFYGYNKRKIAYGEWTYSFIKVIGEWVYYLDTGSNAGFYKIRTDGGGFTKIHVLSYPSYNRMGVRDNWLIYNSEDLKYIEMVRISDTYDTDALFDLIRADQLESMLSKLDTEDPFDQARAKRYKEVEVRKYE